MGVSLEEQETVIQFTRDSKECNIYTSDSTMMTKLDKLCKDSPDYYKLLKEETTSGEVVGKLYKLSDKKMISFRSKKTTLELTDEQREKLRERALSNFKK